MREAKTEGKNNGKDMQVNGKWDETKHEFAKGSLQQTNRITFFDKITDYPDKGNAVNLIYQQSI